MKIAIVSPCHQPLKRDWIYSLEREANIVNADVFIIDDSDGKLGELPPKWRVYDYKKQEKALGGLYGTFAQLFHKSSACRILGHIIAYREGYDVVIGLDSDCVVPFYFVPGHLAILNQNKSYGWTSVLGDRIYTRGYPYSMRNWRTVACMGLWDNVLDINGKDRRPDEPRRVNAPGYSTSAAPVPFSGMNFSLVRDAIPGFLFLPNFSFEDDHFSRHDDVWGGYIFQQLARKRHEGIIYGQPVVFHDAKPNPVEDAALEAAMIKHEDKFIDLVDESIRRMIRPATPPSYIEFFHAFAVNFKGMSVVFKELEPALDWWVKVWKEYA